MRKFCITLFCVYFFSGFLNAQANPNQPEGRFHFKQTQLPDHVAAEIVLKARNELILSQKQLATIPKNKTLCSLFEKYCIKEIKPVVFTSKTTISYLYRLHLDMDALERNEKKELEKRIAFASAKGSRKDHKEIEEEVQKQYCLETICAEITKKSLIEYAEPNYYTYIHYNTAYNGESSSDGDNSQTTPFSQTVDDNDNAFHKKKKGGDRPNDPYLSDQWYLQQINAEKAWEIQTGSSNIRVAVIDSGVDYNHEDLEGKIDLETAYDFVSYEGSSVPVEGEDYAPQDNDPMDFDGHGTYVAGIIAATGDNGIGISGIAPDVTIVPLRAIYVRSISGGRYFSQGRSTDFADALLYCCDNDIDIINCSWGKRYESKLIKDAVEKATNAGCLIVAAAGKFGDMTPVYPAAYDKVFSVGSTNREGDLTYLTGWGEWVDVYAPGKDILSLRCRRSDMFGDGSHIYSEDENYYILSGTSAAAPIVTGFCALIASEFPGIDNQEIIQRVKALSGNTEYVKGMGELINGEIDLWRSVALDLSLRNTIHVIGVHFQDEKTGNGNWIAESGETGKLIVYLRDMYQGSLETEIEATIKSDSHHITILDDAGSWKEFGNYKVGGNIDDPFEVVISDDAAINEWIDIEVTISKAGQKLCDKTIFLIANPVVERAVSAYISRIEGRFITENSPYTIVNECWIPKWSNVIIEPGVELRFGDARQGLRVQGRLNVQGTEDQKVVFTKTADAADWGRICFYNSNGESIINHAVIEKGYGCWRFHGGGGIYCENSDITVKNSLIHDCVCMSWAAAGICLIDGASVIEDCIIKDNTGYGKKPFSRQLFPFETPNAGGIYSHSKSLITGCTFTNNTFYLRFAPFYYIELICMDKETVQENIFENDKEYNPEYVDDEGNFLDILPDPIVGLYGEILFQNNIIQNNQFQFTAGIHDIIRVHGNCMVKNNIIRNNDHNYVVFMTNGIFTNNKISNNSGTFYLTNMVSSNIFTNNKSSPLVELGGEYAFCTNNDFSNNKGVLIESRSPKNIILKNKMVNNNSTIFYEGNTMEIVFFENNTIVNNETSALGGNEGFKLFLYNNLFFGNSIEQKYFVLETTNKMLFSGNAFWNNTDSLNIKYDEEGLFGNDWNRVLSPQWQYSLLEFQYPGIGNITADPLFKDPENYDFQLSNNSPCINAGPPDYRFNDMDGTRNDIGVLGGNPYKIYPRTELDVGAARIGEPITRSFFIYNLSEETLVINDITTQLPFSVINFESPRHIVSNSYSIIDIKFSPLEDRQCIGSALIFSDQFVKPFGKNHYELEITGRGTYYTVYSEENGSRHFQELILDKKRSPYLIDKWYDTSGGSPIIIEPGVQIYFTENSILGIFGWGKSCVMEGTPTEPIRFAGLDGALWGGINLYSGSEKYTIQYAIFENMKRSCPFTPAKAMTFQNCTFVNNQFDYLYSSYGPLHITNSILYQNKGTIFERPSSYRFSHSNIENLASYDNSSNYNEKIACIEKDPKFVDAAKGDYRLLPDSPCIGTGENGENMGACTAGSVDTSRPEMLGVTDQGEYTANASTIRGNWNAEDSESAVVEYHCRILKGNPEGQVVRDWKTVRDKTDVTILGIQLDVGETYYIKVKARNRQGLWSETACSDGIVVTDFSRGDVNTDNMLNLADTVGILKYLFAQAPPHCLKAYDLNDDGTVNISDAVFSLVYLFRGGAPPPSPFPGCGLDQTRDELSCNDPSACQ